MLRSKAVFSVPWMALWVVGCVANTAEPTDTNTNWFESCEEDSDCGASLDCVCGQCTLECSRSSDCSQADRDAECVSADECSGAPRVCSAVVDSGPPAPNPDAAPDTQPDTGTQPPTDPTISDGEAGTPTLRVCEGFFHPENQSELDELAGCTELTEGITISFDADLEPLSRVERSGGWISLGNLETTTIDSLQGLRSLRHAYGILLGKVGVSSLAGLENLESLGESEFIDGGLQIGMAPNLQSLEGLQNLKTTKQVLLANLPELRTLDGLESLTQIESLTLRNLDSLVSTEGLSALTSAGVVDVVGCKLLDNLALENLQSVQLVSLWDTGLTSLSGLAGLREIPEFGVANNSELETIDLPALESAQYKLVIGDNPKLKTLLLPELTTVGALTIVNNEQLPTAAAQLVADTADHIEPAKIGGNQGDESELLDPCPWIDDVVCDEEAGTNLCAPDTDLDCDVIPL